MIRLAKYIQEQLSDVDTNWHPKKGLFTGDDPQEIADYLLRNSKDRTQAMQRLCFYMNRAGDKLTNKTVLNKAKQILKNEKIDEKLIIRDYAKSVKLSIKKCLVIGSFIVLDKSLDSYSKTSLRYVDDAKVFSDYLSCEYVPNHKILWNGDYDCYYEELNTSVMKFFFIGLNNIEGIKFLNNIWESNLKNSIINMHDYFEFLPDYTSTLMTLDLTNGSLNKTAHEFVKEDAQKIIDMLKL